MDEEGSDYLIGMVIERNQVSRSPDGKYNIVFNEGHTYEGILSSGVMHEAGRYVWYDGIIYEGDFLDCKISGCGKYIWPDGSSYVGEILNGLRHGKGCFHCAQSETIYDGQWLLGKRHGYGEIIYDSTQDNYYKGHWANDKKQGHGIERFKSGNMYDGEWLDNKRHGEGTMYWKSRNEVYSGQWEQGVQHGYGKHTWILETNDDSQYPLRNWYIGNWKNGVKEGSGSFHYANGAIFKGLWKNDQKHGQGNYSFKNDGELQCQFLNDDIRIGQKYVPHKPDFGCSCSDDDMTVEELGIISNNWSIDEANQVQMVLLRYISKLKKTYNFYSSFGLSLESDEKPVLKQLQFSTFLRDIGIQEHGLSIFDAECITTEYQVDKRIFSTHDPERIYLIKDFMQALLCLTIRIQDTREPFSVYLEKFLSTINSNVSNIHGVIFSGSCEYVSENLKYQKNLWLIYQWMQNQVFGSDAVKYRDALLLIKDCGLINQFFSSCDVISVMFVITSDFNTDMKLSFLEFFEIMLKCAMLYGGQNLFERENTDLNQWQNTLKEFFEDHIFPRYGHLFSIE